MSLIIMQRLVTQVRKHPVCNIIILKLVLQRNHLQLDLKLRNSYWRLQDQETWKLLRYSNHPGRTFHYWMLQWVPVCSLWSFLFLFEKKVSWNVNWWFVRFSPLLLEVFLCYCSFPLSLKTNISKFQFDRESSRRRTTTWVCYMYL